MTKVFKVINDDGHFLAFWRNDMGDVCFYRPKNLFGDEFFSEPYSKWKEVRGEYLANDLQFADTDETIHMAVHFLSNYHCHFDSKKVEISKIEPGKYYPRVWRGHLSDYHSYKPIEPREFYGTQHIQACIAASSLYEYLTDIFRNVEPATENVQTYSHKIRECLILACTEVETSWRAIWEANADSKNHKQRYNTEHYIMLKEPLHLDEWSVALKDYPSLGEMRPFEKWCPTSPTKSLPWYDDYNAVKHHREAEFKKATLGNLLNAVAAVHIMQAAQWGPEVYEMMIGNRPTPFNIIQYPSFQVNELYMPNLDGSGLFQPLNCLDIEE